MSDRESSGIRRIIGWSIIGLIVIIGIPIALSFYFSRSLEAFYYPFFFPFRFGWLGGIFLIFIVFWIARWFFWPWRGWYMYEHTNAESILKERYAKGEITKEQFEQVMRDLEHRS
jgi:putative membrane protein